MNAAARLTAKCAHAKALMEEAQQLIEEVLEDAAYSRGVLPRGVVPDGVNDYLPDAIGMLTPEPVPEPWDDDYEPHKTEAAHRSVPRLVIDNTRRGQA